MSRASRLLTILLAAGTLLVCPVLAGPATAGPAPGESSLELAVASSPASIPLQESAGETVSLSRDGEDGVLHSFTIEGEDRVSISFARPDISLDLDPRSAPGLGWRNAWDRLDIFPAVIARSSLTESPFTGQPWLQVFAQDDVVVFHPQAPDMATWQLTIVDSRGKAVATRRGEGAPPSTLAWDGRCDDGTAAWPGLVYSYVMETVDPAGNLRTFSGRGFQLPAYRLPGVDEDLLVFCGTGITGDTPWNDLADPSASPLIEETASWLNQAPGLTAPIEIRATARNTAQARHLADLVADALSGRVCGAPGRITTVVKVVPDAPDQGIVEVASRAIR